MKTRLIFILILMMGGWFLPNDLLAKKPLTVRVEKGEAVVSYLEGTAQFHPKGRQEWQDLQVKSSLRGGDEISVGRKSRLEMVLPDSSRLRFAENTNFKILQAGENASRDIKLHLAVGRAWANVSKAAGIKRKFEIACDNAVTGVRGTIYRLNVNQDASALVRVYEGEIAVSGATKPLAAPTGIGPPTKIAGPKKVAGPRKVSMEEWTVIIRSMQQISIRSDGSADQPREFSEQEDRDAWVDWNKTMDEEL